MNRIAPGIVLVLVALCGWLWFVTVPGLEADLAKAESEARAKTVEADALRAAVSEQNERVAELERTAQALGALAGARLEAERNRSALRRAGVSQSGTGPEEMNRWQRALFR